MTVGLEFTSLLQSNSFSTTVGTGADTMLSLACIQYQCMIHVCSCIRHPLQQLTSVRKRNKYRTSSGEHSLVLRSTASCTSCPHCVCPLDAKISPPGVVVCDGNVHHTLHFPTLQTCGSRLRHCLGAFDIRPDCSSGRTGVVPHMGTIPIGHKP
jgi:hypothetical protein